MPLDSGNSSNLISKEFVVFLDIKDQYDLAKENVSCKFRVQNNYEAQDGDRVGVLKVGWSSVREYLAFEWVTPGKSTIEVKIKQILLEEQFEAYQLCYINKLNQLCGASTPFQIKDSSPQITHTMTDSGVVLGCCHHVNEVNKLKVENRVLREALNIVTSNCSSVEKLAEKLKTNLQKLQTCMACQQSEIDNLRKDLQVAKEDNAKLYSEKVVLHKKLNDLKVSCEESQKKLTQEFSNDMVTSTGIISHDGFEKMLQDLMRKLEHCLQTRSIKTLKHPLIHLEKPFIESLASNLMESECDSAVGDECNVSEDVLAEEAVTEEQIKQEILSSRETSALNLGDLKPMPPFPFKLY